MQVTLAHIRKYGGYRYCSRGLRHFAARYGIDWDSFIRKGGVDEQTLLNTGDTRAAQIVECVRNKTNG